MNKKNKKPTIGVLIAAVAISVMSTFFGVDVEKYLDKLENVLEIFSFEESPKISVNINLSQLENVPDYKGHLYVSINQNLPNFTEDEKVAESFEYYSPLDHLDRVGVAIACIGKDLMPSEKRESISSIYPTGWVQNPYPGVENDYLYNRSHLIGFQLTGENANEKNLMTGTRIFNAEGMLLFENMVADYVKETNHHVLYRVTPYFEGDDLLAKGVQMEAYSVEDDGKGVCFNVFVYNIQPGIEINYHTGDNRLEK